MTHGFLVCMLKGHQPQPPKRYRVSYGIDGGQNVRLYLWYPKGLRVRVCARCNKLLEFKMETGIGA